MDELHVIGETAEHFIRPLISLAIDELQRCGEKTDAARRTPISIRPDKARGILSSAA